MTVLRLEGSSWVDVLPGLSLLSDVDVSTVPATGDVVLGYDRDTGTWVPVLDQVGEGGGGSTPGGAVTYWQPEPYTVSAGTSHRRRLLAAT